MYMGGSTLSLAFLKNISSILSGSALSPAPFSQSRHTEYPSCIASSICFQLSPQAKMAPLSMYIPNNELVHSSILWRSGDMYMVDRTGETGTLEGRRPHSQIGPTSYH